MKFVSFYNSNISDKVVKAQRSVFNKFGYDIEQILTPLQHPDAIDDYLLNRDWEHIAIFDIDCIPLSQNALIGIELLKKAPVIYGAAQRASHIKDSKIYASPAFICFSKAIYNILYRPSFKATERGDVGAEITYKANELGIPVVYLWPVDVAIPKWPLREGEMFGLGTNYENKIYHAFESRMNHDSTNMFIQKCHEIISFDVAV